MDMIKVYESIEREMLSDTEQTLYVLQGFPFDAYKAIENIGISHLLKKKFDKYIDFHIFEDKGISKSLLMALMTSEQSAWLFYEEFITLCKVVTDFSIYQGKIVIVQNNLFEGYYPIPIQQNEETILKLYSKESNSDNDIFEYYSDCKLIDGIMYYAYVNKHYEIDTGIKIEERGILKPGKISRQIPENCEKISLSSLKTIKNKIQLGQIKNSRFLITEHSATLFDEIAILNKLGEYFDVAFFAEGNEKKNVSIDNEYLSILQRYWGKNAKFRKNVFYKEPEISSETIEISQGEIIVDVLNQCLLANADKEFSDLIITAPTGAGKSLLFQIPSVYLYEKYKEITIVICPLVALMVDQVKELNERGIGYATFINSSITFEERKERMDGIKSGKYSIVYLSPELLLSMDLRSFIDKRKIGLIVVDEAHLVTSWGRDFRVDYWFLGDYLEKVRHGSYYSKEEKINVPILCLTATAVFGGKDDVIGDLQNSLQLVCNSEQLYIGYVRRDDIIFDIRHPKKESRSDKEEKIGLTVNELERNSDKGIKTIAYFPYKSSIDDVWNRLRDDKSPAFDQIVKYHSGEDIGSIEKDQAYREFRDSEKILMLATKAFGMGVNISDINEVYHFAPTGTLADYVQEIGRAARKLETGYAVTDYLPTDMHYARTLWGLSGLRHYQTQEMIKKLYELYNSKKKRNLLLSPDTFNYLFDNKSVEGKVKSGLMLISGDLLEKYHFKVIAVRTKSLFSKQYITVPAEIESIFMSKYGKYCVEMDDVKPRKEYNRNGYDSCTYKNGKVYEMDLATLWENDFSEKTFPKFKWDFFNGKLFEYGETKIVPNSKLIIKYKNNYEETKVKFYKLANAIQDTFNRIKRVYGGRNFTLKDFSDIFSSFYEEPIRKEYIAMLLDMFCYNHIDLFEFPKENWKFVERKKSDENDGMGSNFCIRTQKTSFIGINLRKYFALAEPNTEEETYITYVSIVNGDLSGGAHLQLLASILQLFDMGTYEMYGGKNPEIFVRINDPQKLKRIASSEKKYRNSLLTKIEQRHERAISIMNRFMKGNFSNVERWKIIEEYFLGHDENVEILLEKGNFGSEKDKKKEKITKEQVVIVKISGENFKDYYLDWNDASMIDEVEDYILHNILIPDYINGEVEVNYKKYEYRYMWENSKAIVFEEFPEQTIINQLEKAGWVVCNANNIDYKNLKSRIGE